VSHLAHTRRCPSLARREDRLLLKSIAYRRNGRQEVMNGKNGTMSKNTHHPAPFAERLCFVAGAPIAAGDQVKRVAGVYFSVLRGIWLKSITLQGLNIPLSFVNFGNKLLSFRPFFWREYISSSGFSRQFLRNSSKKRASDQQSNYLKNNNLMSKFTPDWNRNLPIFPSARAVNVDMKQVLLWQIL